MTVNVELLRRVHAFVRAHPENYEQQVWGFGLRRPVVNGEPPCGSRACIAGWTCALEGWQVSGAVALRGGERRLVPEVAAELLGLSDDQRLVLFSSDLPDDQLDPLVDAICNGEDGDSLWRFLL